MTGECLDKSEKMQFVGEDDFLINAQQNTTNIIIREVQTTEVRITDVQR